MEEYHNFIPYYCKSKIFFRTFEARKNEVTR